MIAIFEFLQLREKAKAYLRWEEPRPRWPSLVALLRKYLHWSRTTQFDAELRYDIALRYLSERSHRSAPVNRILDAGSGPHGFARYAGRECVGLDLAFPRDRIPDDGGQMRRVVGSMTHLPFRERSFDLVLSFDTLEHLPPSQRPAAVRELFRVASKALVIGVPYGTEAAAHDRWAAAIERARGDEPDWRREHVSNGLPGPELDQLIASSAVVRNAVRFRVRNHESLLGLKLRWLIGRRISQSHPAYGLVLGPLFALSKRLHFGACYRRAYFAEFV